MAKFTNLKCLVVSNPSRMASIDTMALDITAAMRSLGIGARIFMSAIQGNNPSLFQNLLEEMKLHPGPSLIIDINAKMKILTKESNFFDLFDVPKFSFITDNPIHHISHLKNIPNNSLCGMVSEEHLEHSRLFGLDPEKCIFFPHGGPPALSHMRKTSERNIELLFAGNISEVPCFKEWADETFANNSIQKKVMLKMSKYIDSSAPRLFSILSETITNIGNFEKCMILEAIFGPFERFLINRERFRILSAIKKHPVTVIGNVSNEIVRMLPQHSFLGEKTYTEVMDAMTRSKISLNISPSFKSGGHERIFYSLAYGGYLLTDKNDFLKKDRLLNPFINFFPNNINLLDKIITKTLNDTKLLDEQRKISTSHYSQNHTWEKRVLPILNKLQKTYWDKP